MTTRRILVPVDYSECSRRALEFAAGLSDTLGSSLDIVHVWDKPTYISDAILVRHPGAAPRTLIEMVRDNAKHDMNEFLATVQLPRRTQATHRLISGDPTTRLLEELEKGEHDLVVVGTHGRSGLTHFLLGSVAEKLVRHSPVPVLTVPRTTVDAS